MLSRWAQGMLELTPWNWYLLFPGNYSFLIFYIPICFKCGLFAVFVYPQLKSNYCLLSLVKLNCYLNGLNVLIFSCREGHLLLSSSVSSFRQLLLLPAIWYNAFFWLLWKACF